MNIKSLFKTVMLITIFSIITRIAGFIFRIYLSRTIGAESLGVYQISFSVFIVLVTIICSGLPLTVSRLTAKYETLNNNSAKNKTITSALIIGALSSLMLCLAVLVCNKLFNFIFADSRCFIILLTLLPAVVFSSVYAVLRGVLWGQNNYFVVCVLELLEQLVRIIVCVFALSFMYIAVDGVVVASTSLTIATFVSSLAICVYYFKKGGKLERPQDEHKELIKTSLPITGIRVVSSLIQPIIAFLIPLGLVSAGYTNSDAVALYGIAMGMAFPLLFLPTTIVDSLAIALIPDLASALACNNNNYINSRIKTSIVFSFYIACLCTPIFIGLGVPICEFLFNNTQAGLFLEYSAIIMVPLALSGISATILNSLNLERKSFRNYIMGSIFLIISVIIFPKYLGIYSITLGLGLSTSTTTILNLLELKKQNKFNGEIIKPICALIAFILPTSYIISNFFGVLSGYFPCIINLAICGIVGGVCFMLLCEVFNIMKINQVLANFKIIKHKKQKSI